MRGDLYSEFMKLANDYIQDVFRKVTGVKKLKIGCVVVLHTAGRSGSYTRHRSNLMNDITDVKNRFQKHPAMNLPHSRVMNDC